MNKIDGHNLGARLKAFRKERGLRMADVKALTGLAISTISKVENGQMSMTYDKLVQLAAGLDLDITQLINGGAAPQQPVAPTAARRSVDRAGDGSLIKAGFYDYCYLNTDLTKKAMTPILGETRAKSLEAFGDLIRHPGEEFLLILSGVLEVHTDVYSPMILREGDSIYIDSSMGHAYLVGEGDVCRFLCVCVGDSTEQTLRALQAKNGRSEAATLTHTAEGASPVERRPPTRRAKAPAQRPKKTADQP